MTSVKTNAAVLFAAILASLACLAFASLAHGASVKPKTTMVSVKSNGKGGPASSDFPSLSATGRYSCFESLNKLTGTPDAGIDDDVFVHDRVTGKTVRASVKANGKEPAGPADSNSCSLSADGKEVSFRSDAKLVGADNNGSEDVYVKNLRTGKVTLASVTTNGDQLSGVSVDNPRISGNGRYVAWDTDGAFSPADVNGFKDVYRNDLKTGKTVQVSLRYDGSQPVDGDSTEPSLSANGQRIAFESDDGSMTTDTDYQFLIDKDIFVRDLKQGTTVRASLSSNGDEPSYPFQSPPSNVNSDNPVISADGKFVAFHSIGVYNGTDDNLSNGDVFIHSLATGKTSLVSLDSNGAQATGESGYTDPHPIEISADGRYVAFDSLAKLSGKDTDSVGDVYVRDRKLGKTQLATVKSNGKPLSSTDAALPALSADGKWVAWASADPYAAGDANNDSDIFERGPVIP
jgi:Tol biopolymer transport system component